MESKLAKTFKIDSHYSNINHVYTIIKETLLLITDVLK